MMMNDDDDNDNDNNDVVLYVSLAVNVFLDGTMGLRMFQTGACQPEFYKDSDLTLGTALNVWGRKFILCDCDDFTKEYYKTKYGISKF
jgi:hypothetical protein